MDSIADDPELAKELVKLLGQELKVLRAQLKEVQIYQYQYAKKYTLLMYHLTIA